MSLQSVQREMLKEAKVVFSNPKLQLKDIIEWSTSEEMSKKNLEESEVLAKVPMGVWVAINEEHDKRKPTRKE